MKLQILRLLIGLAVLGIMLAVIWMLGGLLEPPHPEHGRRTITLTAMLGVTLLFLGGIGVAYLKSLRGAASIEQSLRAQALAQFAGARPDKKGEVDELRKQFETALDALRRSVRGRTALHSLPLYVLIGPPGSGKTTMLRESGIEFPFMAGRREIRGVGGTRNCDWWFGARGIMLDTAGRYMVEQDDREEWLAFLGLIRRARGRRAIDGAVVAMSLGDIVAATDTELRTHAEMVRERIDELTQQLGVVFPVYLVFTKCDQLAGFVEFFERLTKEERKQVWGFSVPLRGGAPLAEAFGAEFDALYRALSRRRLQEFTVERGRKKKEKSYSFPLQFALTRQRIRDFLGLLGQANPYQEASPLRGVYFTSGTQEGTVISQLQRTIYEAAEMAIDVPPDQRKCYFIDDLFEKVVFGDAGLAQPTAAARRRMRIARWAGLGAAAAAGLLLAWHSVAHFVTRGGELDGHRASVVALQKAWPAALLGERPARAVSPGALAALRDLWARLPEGGAPADADDPAVGLVRTAFHDGLRVTFVTACLDRGIDEVRRLTVAELAEAEAAAADYVVVDDDYAARKAAAEEWALAAQALTRTGAVPLADAKGALGRLQREWDACLVEERETYRPFAMRWFEAFVAARASAPELVAGGRATDFPAGEVQQNEARMQRNLGLLWDSFTRKGVAEQLRLFREEGAAVVELASLGVDCAPFRPGTFTLPELYATGGSEHRVDTNLAHLTERFLRNVPPAAADARRQELAGIGARGKAELRRRRAQAWVRLLDVLQPRALATWKDAEPWIKGDEVRLTTTEQVARAIARAFGHPDGAAEAKFTSLLRGGANLEAFQSRLGVAAGSADVSGLIEGMVEYRKAVGALRPRLAAALRPDVDADVTRAFGELEGRVLSAVERLAAVQLAGEIDRAWAGVKGRLEEVAGKYPFDPAARDDSAVSAATFQRLFAGGSPFEALDRIVTLGTSRLGDGQDALPLSETTLQLHKRLRLLREAFVDAQGSFRAELRARPYVGAGLRRFTIEALGYRITDATDQAEYSPFPWTADDHVAQISLVTDSGATLTLRDLANAADREPGSYRGVWSLLRMVQRGEYVPAAGRVLWRFGTGSTQLGLDLADSPLRRVLEERDAFRLTVPRSLFDSS